jgi:hypothetical protein
MMFVAYGLGKWKISTVVTYMTGGIGGFFREHGLEGDANPVNHWRVQKTIKGLRRRLGLTGEDGAQPSEALDMELLELMLRDLRDGRMRNGAKSGARVSAFEQRQGQIMLAAGQAGLMRRSEIARVWLSRVVVDADGRSRWTLTGVGTPGKTDEACEGQTVQLPAVVAGCQLGRLILEQRRELYLLGLKDNDLFFRDARRPRERGWHPNGEAVGKALRRYISQTVPRHRLQRPEVSKFSAHSLRRGGAQWLRDLGLSRDLVKLHGRWKSDAVDAYFVGIGRETEEQIADLFASRREPDWVRTVGDLRSPE